MTTENTEQLDNIMYHEAAMAILDDAAKKLRQLGIHAVLAPCGLPTGMTVSLHASMTERGMAGAYVAKSEGAVGAHVEPARFEADVDQNLKDWAAMAAMADDAEND
jgi:hypothetical protein